MHELVFRSRGGKVSRKNSIAVCGDGVEGCHGHLQAHRVQFGAGQRGAESTLVFTPVAQIAADWLRVKVGESIESPPMRNLDEMSNLIVEP